MKIIAALTQPLAIQTSLDGVSWPRLHQLVRERENAVSSHPLMSLKRVS